MTSKELRHRHRYGHQPTARTRRGAMLVLIAFMMIAFMAMVVFSVDVAYMHLVRAQLRSSTDAAAKAATDTLSLQQSLPAARRAARDLASANRVANLPLSLANGDIEFGRARVLTSGRVEFLANQSPFGATHVTGRRDQQSADGAVRLFFGQTIGVPTFQPVIEATASRRDRDICLVVDRSGSMAGSKFVDLRDAVRVFLTTLDTTPQDESVGLASYATRPSLNNALTTNMNAINRSMNSMIAAGFTNIGGGIDVGRGILANGRDTRFVEKTMIVMTDGRHNTGTDPVQAANRAAADRITIHGITFGSGADQTRMRQVAQATGGTFNHAPNGQALIDIYREIALTLVTQLTE